MRLMTCLSRGWRKSSARRSRKTTAAAALAPPARSLDGEPLLLLHGNSRTVGGKEFVWKEEKEARESKEGLQDVEGEGRRQELAMRGVYSMRYLVGIYILFQLKEEEEDEVSGRKFCMVWKEVGGGRSARGGELDGVHNRVGHNGSGIDFPIHPFL